MSDATAKPSQNGHRAKDTRPVLFVDIDNTLYSKSKKVHDMMGELIDKYFTTHLSLTLSAATKLHTTYYTSYGLAIEGLVRHHEVDPLEYNAQVDDALPLEEVLTVDEELIELLEDVDTSKVRLWLFTNAYVNHARRVIRLIGVDRRKTRGSDGTSGSASKDEASTTNGAASANKEHEDEEYGYFEGLTYCDYGAATNIDPATGEMEGFVCKPHRRMFEKAMREAGVEDPEKCYFVDDSALNCRAAAQLGWTAAHLVEPSDSPPKEQASQHQIRDVKELRTCFPQFFKSTTK